MANKKVNSDKPEDDVASFKIQFHEDVENKKILDEYNIIKKIGSGSFGEVYLTETKKDRTFVAMKVEEKNPDHTRLHDEYKIYCRLHKKGFGTGIPKIHELYETPRYNILVMQLLGESLDGLFVKYNKKFTVSTVLKLGIDMTYLLKKLHTCNYIHRDIKPNNFMVGKHDPETLYIMDFGLSRKYHDGKRHISYKSDRSLVGTARYASINVHEGKEPSRRDDLESIAYILIYFLKGSLPWQGLKKEKGVDHLEKISEVKITTSHKKLCEGLPTCIYDYLSYCRKLNFEEKPDYELLTSYFIRDAKKLDIIPRYEWV